MWQGKHKNILYRDIINLLVSIPEIDREIGFPGCIIFIKYVINIQQKYMSNGY